MLGVKDIEAGLQVLPGLSLEGLIDKPSAPMLVIGGCLDTQVPFNDTILLLTHGSPKSAWINPTGVTMARSDTVKDPYIFANVVMPWVAQQFAATPK